MQNNKAIMEGRRNMHIQNQSFISRKHHKEGSYKYKATGMRGKDMHNINIVCPNIDNNLVPKLASCPSYQKPSPKRGVHGSCLYRTSNLLKSLQPKLIHHQTLQESPAVSRMKLSCIKMKGRMQSSLQKMSNPSVSMLLQSCRDKL